MPTVKNNIMRFGINAMSAIVLLIAFELFPHAFQWFRIGFVLLGDTTVGRVIPS